MAGLGGIPGMGTSDTGDCKESISILKQLDSKLASSGLLSVIPGVTERAASAPMSLR